MSFDLKASVPCYVNIWYYEPDFSTLPSIYAGNYNQYYIANPSATSYKRYSFTFTPRYSHCVITLRISGSSPANTYWKNLVLVEGTDTNYVEPEEEGISIATSISGTDLLEINPLKGAVYKNSSSINSAINSTYFLDPITLKWEKNTFKLKGQGAFRITLRR
jgi:hypothetical protein